jgi:hypothetical protein
MHFIFPSHPMKQAVVEPMFTDQLASIRAAGFSTSVFSDSVIREGKPIRNLPVGAARLKAVFASVEWRSLFLIQNYDISSRAERPLRC